VSGGLVAKTKTVLFFEKGTTPVSLGTVFLYLFTPLLVGLTDAPHALAATLLI
jgi:hypothetical protein